MKLFSFFKNNLFFQTIFICTALTLFLFRSLVGHIFTNLPDWNDYPYIAWILFQNIAHFKAGMFGTFFDGNIFFPDKNTLFFADTFLPQSVIACIVSLFSDNPVFAFNIAFLSTFILNAAASFVFWKDKIFSRPVIFAATVFTAFSPFVILNLDHLQVITLWPFFFSLYFLLKEKKSLFSSILAGFFMSVQFLAGVYLSLFLIFLTAGIFVLDIWKVRNKKEKVLKIVKRGVVVFITFGILAGPFLYKYIQVEHYYHIKREYWEYVLYSAHVSDYVFSNHYLSLEGKIPFIADWNGMNKHSGESAGFPGFVLLILAVTGFYTILKNKNKLKDQQFFLKNSFLFSVLAVTGFVFSLGPRLNFNGVYIGTILPYNLVLKVLPLVEPIRANARWSFYFFFGLTFFSLAGLIALTQKNKNRIFLTFLVIGAFLFEIFPVNIQTTSRDYYPKEEAFLQTLCKPTKQVLLEYPMTEDREGANVVTNLSYRSQMMLASVRNNCTLVNGYSGYIPDDYTKYESELGVSVIKNDEVLFWKLIKKRGVTLVKLNKLEIYESKDKELGEWLTDGKYAKMLLEDSNVLIVKVL